MTNSRTAQTGFSRVFTISGRARPSERPEYANLMKAGAISQSFGDVTDIEVPSPNEWGKFLKVGAIRGQTERVTMTLTGRYAADLRSQMLALARQGCAIDVQINFGTCTDPANYNIYSKKVLLENALITAYNTDDLGALSSDEQAVVNESVDVSGDEVYEMVQATFSERGNDVIEAPLNSVKYSDQPSCGDCETESNGCATLYAVGDNTVASPTGAPLLYVSVDGGATITTETVDTAANDLDDVDGVGQYVMVCDSTAELIHYALKTDLDTWVSTSTGVASGGGPFKSVVTGGTAFVIGLTGHIYSTTNPSNGLTLLDAGVASGGAELAAVDAVSASVAVAVGASGAIVSTQDGVVWSDVSAFPGSDNLLSVTMQTARVWLVGDAVGTLYYTEDAGATWSSSTPTGVIATTGITALSFASDSVVYLGTTPVSGDGAILMSTNAGYDWVVLPQGAGSIPANEGISSIAGCAYEPGTVIAGGIGDGGVDGIFILGR